MDNMTEDACSKANVLACRKLISDVKMQIKAFEILAEQNPHLGPNILVQNLRKILRNKDHGHSDKSTDVENDSHHDGKLHDEHGLVISNWAQVVESFTEMHLNPLLIRGIHEYGYEVPSTVQKRAIVPCVNGWDLIVQSHPESGKTAAIVIATLQRIDMDSPHCQALIITHTPEAARHILELVKGLGAFMDIRSQTSTTVSPDGLNLADPHFTLDRGVQIFVGTCHEVRSLLNSRAIRPDDVEILIVDDAHLLLSGELKEETYEIMKTLAMQTQIVLMSTGLPCNILAEAKDFMRHPVNVWVQDEVKTENTEQLTKGVLEFVVDVETDEFKLPALEDMYEKLSGTQSIVFCNNLDKVELLAEKMKRRNHDVSFMHGYMDTDERQSTLKKFATGGIPMLITTDWLIAGIERIMSHIPLVINYDFPAYAKIYIPRTGLGRRFGLGHLTISFVSANDRDSFNEVQHLFGGKIAELPTDFIKYLHTRTQW